MRSTLLAGSNKQLNCCLSRSTRPNHRRVWQGGKLSVQGCNRGRIHSLYLRAIPETLTLGLDSSNLEMEADSNGLTRLKYREQGWSYWDWEGRKIHYLETGPREGPTVVLVHGYGASAYHWRYNIPALADRGFHVLAIDLLGFGWSERCVTDYSNGGVWVKELSDFAQQFAPGKQVVLVGNSLGGYASMATAAAHPDLVRGLVLVNSAGPFEDATKAPHEEVEPWWGALRDSLVNAAKRVVLFFAFQQARAPSRIQEVLRLVYVNHDQVDEPLVASIVRPTLDPAAAEVFYRINVQRGPGVTVNSLLRKLKVPVLLLWGDRDPWMTPSRAARIQQLYPAAQRVSLDGGHCPHDDVPAAANAALLKWVEALPPMA